MNVPVVEHKNVCCVNIPIYLEGNILLKLADLFFCKPFTVHTGWQASANAVSNDVIKQLC